LPLDLGQFFQQLLDFLITLNVLADAFFPFLGHEHLAGLATPALHQVQRAVQFPVGTATIRFATAAPTHRQRAAQKGLAGNDLML